MMKRRIATLLAVVIPVVLVALFWQPVVDAVFLEQEGAIASARMAGSVVSDGGETPTILWEHVAGPLVTFDSTDVLDPIASVTALGLSSVRMTLTNSAGSHVSETIIFTHAKDDTSSDISPPVGDAGPDVTITEGDFASP